MASVDRKVNRLLESRKDVILQQAARLFREKGYMATTLRELAEKSGVKGGSIYHHFSSKQEILFQIMGNTLDTLINRLTDVLSDLEDPVEKLKKAIAFHIEFHVADSDETNVTDIELRSLDRENYDIIVGKRRLYEDIFLRILGEGVRNQAMNINDVKLTCMAIIQMCTSVSFWFRADGPLSLNDIVDRYVDLICWGVLGKGKRDV